MNLSHAWRTTVPNERGRPGLPAHVRRWNTNPPANPPPHVGGYRFIPSGRDLRRRCVGRLGAPGLRSSLRYLGGLFKPTGVSGFIGLPANAKPYFRGLYHIQSLPGSRPCIRFFFMIAVKSHCWPCPSTKRTGEISLSGSRSTVPAVYIFPGFEAPCHEVMLA